MQNTITWLTIFFLIEALEEDGDGGAGDGDDNIPAAPAWTGDVEAWR